MDVKRLFRAKTFEQALVARSERATVIRNLTREAFTGILRVVLHWAAVRRPT